MRCWVQPAGVDDALRVAAHCRDADRAEFLAASGRTPEEVVRDGLADSVMAFTGWAGEDPVCVFGVATWSLVAGVGIPWMVGTDQLPRHSRALLRTSRPAVELMHARFPELVNYVDARNVAAIRWLRWLGFKVEPAAPYGVAGLPFHRFSRDCRHV
jgi:hypothetical protein